MGLLVAVLLCLLGASKARALTPPLTVSPAAKRQWGLMGQVVCVFFDESLAPFAQGPAAWPEGYAEEGRVVGTALSVIGSYVTQSDLVVEKRGAAHAIAARRHTRRAQESALLQIASRERPITRERADDKSDLCALRGEWYQRSGKGTQYVAQEAVAPLAAMLAAAKADGCTGIYIASSYRDYAYQQRLFEASLKKYAKTRSAEAAYDYTASRTAVPGGSEHHLGYTLDLLENGASMSAAFAKTRLGKWLKENAAAYGFILRYGEDKTPVTGIIYEPWHVRYVGVPAARLLKEKGWCMEEFHEALEREGFLFYSGDAGSAVFIYVDAALAYGEGLTLSPMGDGYIAALQLTAGNSPN